MKPIESLIAAGSKVWIDSVDPQLMQRDRGIGITGATSNPLIVSDLIQSGLLKREIEQATSKEGSDNDIVWELTDLLVRRAQRLFLPVWEQTGGNDGYVSFESGSAIGRSGGGIFGRGAVGAVYQIGEAMGCRPQQPFH